MEEIIGSIQIRYVNKINKLDLKFRKTRCIEAHAALAVALLVKYQPLRGAFGSFVMVLITGNGSIIPGQVINAQERIGPDPHPNFEDLIGIDRNGI
jgi:hypothetical protein